LGRADATANGPELVLDGVPVEESGAHRRAVWPDVIAPRRGRLTE
jgi:hypothetical protein